MVGAGRPAAWRTGARLRLRGPAQRAGQRLTKQGSAVGTAACHCAACPRPQNKTMEKVLAVREAMMRAFEDFKVRRCTAQHHTTCCRLAARELGWAIPSCCRPPSSSEAAALALLCRRSPAPAASLPNRPAAPPPPPTPHPTPPLPGQCVTTEQQLRGVEGQSAQGLMAAIQNLPTAEDMDAFAAAGGGASGSSSPEASRGAALSAAGAFGAGEGQESKAPEGQAGRMWAGIRSGVEIDGSVLERAEAVPPPTNADIVRRVQQMAHPRDMIHYWHAWLVRGGRGGGRAMQ